MVLVIKCVVLLEFLIPLNFLAKILCRFYKDQNGALILEQQNKVGSVKAKKLCDCIFLILSKEAMV